MCSYHECSAVTPNCEKRKSVLKKFSFNKVLTRTLTFKLVLPAYKSTCHRYSLSYKTVELNSVSGSFETVIRSAFTVCQQTSWTACQMHDYYCN